MRIIPKYTVWLLILFSAVIIDPWLFFTAGPAEAASPLGALSAKQALEYMKKTPDLVIIETNAPEWKMSSGIDGALWIPYTEIEKRSAEIPKGRPVLLYCGGGIVSAKAYETLLRTRPDITELSYIAAAPPAAEYNEWKKSRRQIVTP